MWWKFQVLMCLCFGAGVLAFVNGNVRVGTVVEDRKIGSIARRTRSTEEMEISLFFGRGEEQKFEGPVVTKHQTIVTGCNRFCQMLPYNSLRHRF